MKIKRNIPFVHNNNIYWVLTDTCNYRCPYCFTLGKDPSPISPLDIASGLEKSLKGKWEITFSGGEVFLHEEFLGVVKKMVGAKHRISVFSNFSAKPEKIVEFLKITEGRLSIFYAALHLNSVKPDDFMKKVAGIEKSRPGFKKRLFVCAPGTVENLPYLEGIKKKFFEAGIPFIIWTHRLPRGGYFEYSVEQKKFLKKLNQNYNAPEYNDFIVASSNRGLDEESISFRGSKCSAGRRSFFIIPGGAAYACFADCRAKTGYLGHFLKNDFKLNKTLAECPYEKCYCPLPINQFFWEGVGLENK